MGKLDNVVPWIRCGDFFRSDSRDAYNSTTDMTIKSFIEKAIEGGWRWREFPERPIVRVSNEVPGLVELWYDYKDGGGNYSRIQPESILLEPEAWKAVGKVEGWVERCMDCDGDVVRKMTPEYPNLPHGLSWCPNRCPRKNFMSGWHHKMHLMVTALAEGKTIEQYLETL